ncbi:MAG: ATP-binding protein [Clostridia bacterium]|nr:ATP-binding protein [Clostridia bacterium]
MESAYTLANRALTERREENRAEQERRVVEVRSAFPEEYDRIEAGLRRGGTALARCVLTGGMDYEKIEESIRSLQKQRRELLKSLGKPEDYLEEVVTCSLCRDTGFLETGRRCGCLEELIANSMGASSNLTGIMKEQTFDKVDYTLFAKQPKENGREPLTYMKTAYEKGFRFADTFDKTHGNLLLMGNAGTGKTYLSSCIANHALKRGKSVYYQTAFRLFELLEKLKFDRLLPEEEELAAYSARQIHQADLLIIDDLGTEFVTAYSAAAVFDLINSRQLQGKSTVVSTNLNLEGLEKIYSKRLTSRFLGGFEIIPFIGQDLRMQKHIRTGE